VTGQGSGAAGEPPAGDASARAGDEAFLRLALEEARAAYALGEVPIGAVVVLEGAVVSRAHNLRETNADPTAHAEVVALREAARVLDSWRLDGATLYVTLEPCFMCAGALVNARVARLVFGAHDPKAGAVGSLADVARDVRLNHRLEVRSGVLATECGDLLKRFFAERRALGSA
jgi:tRNA(adenine34) deaminase